jgi:sugar lactone lactonase YvrE
MTLKPTIIYKGLAFGEAPRRHGGKIWFSDMHNRKIMTIDAENKVATIVDLPDRPSGLGWTLDDQLLIVYMKQKKLVRWDKDGLHTVADISALASGECNDMVVDALGRAYIGNFGKGTDLGKDIIGPGEIVMVTPDGKASIAADDITFPNGSVITPDGKTFIVAETFGCRLTSFDIKPDGTLVNRQVWAPLEEKIDPDGICLDAEGAVWVANAFEPAVYRIKRGGEVLQTISTSARAFACMLGGDDRRTLYMFTAENTDARICRQKMSARIETLPVEVPGAGLP